MQITRWTNPSLPQTLQIAVFLLYFDAVFEGLLPLLSGLRTADGLVVLTLIKLGVSSLNGLRLCILLLMAGFVFGALGIANESKAGYYVAVGVSTFMVATIPALMAWGIIDVGWIFDLRNLIAVVFPVAELVALLHPMSRNYIKIWFS